VNIRRWSSGVFLFALSGCSAVTWVHYKLAPDYPRDETQTLTLPGLSQPARIVFDPEGVPHIDAANDSDLARAVGYAQGRERFFEMDLMRRFARGRVSELVGERPLFSGTTVDFDRSMRGWDFAARATEVVAALPADERATLHAYCEGVNAAVARHPPIEHRLLGVQPEPWTEEDTWAVGILNAWTVSHNWQQELARFLLASSVGLARGEAIYPAEPLEGGKTLPPAGPPHELPPSVVPEMKDLFDHPMPRAEGLSPTGLLALAGASNAWVVSGARSKSGKPVLANDPHLQHLVPSIVFPQHLHAPGWDVIGATVPGLPWVLMGHNAQVAWGVTSTVADVMDLIVERPDPARPGFVLHAGGDCALSERDEVFQVKGAEPRTLHFRRTCNGPLLNDMLPALFPQGAPLLAVRWHLYQVEKTLRSVAAMNRAGSLSELRAAAAQLGTPLQTVTAADVEGHIAPFVTGSVPIRPNHRGTFPVPGWLAAYEWTGAATPEQMPSGMDPDAGFFDHSNNLMVDPRTSEVPVNIDAAPPYRYERVVERLGQVDKHDVDSFADIQRDVKLLRAQRLVPRLLEDLAGHPPRTPVDVQALELLRGWDFEARADSAAAALFFVIYREAVLAAIDDELPGPAREFFLAQRYSTNVEDAWFERVDHPVWDKRDTPAVETRTDIVRAAFERAVDQLAAAQGAEPARWRWGALHRLEPRHPFGGQSLLAGTVNLEPAEMGGGLDSIWKSHFDIGNEKAPFKDVAGPVYRMVVDLADLAHGRWVVDTGASGWPSSPHYADQYALWRTGRLAPMRFDWKELERDAQGTLTLIPGGL
jgi:penicillin amidase